MQSRNFYQAGMLVIFLSLGILLSSCSSGQEPELQLPAAETSPGSAEPAAGPGLASSISDGRVAEEGVTEEQVQVENAFGEQPALQESRVEILSSGFSPASVRISVGSSITFVNRDSRPHWPASNIHPTHELYPGSGISKCNSPAQAGIFDACRGLAPGEEYTFQFNHAGNWRYHDHLRPSMAGTIIVE